MKYEKLADYVFRSLIMSKLPNIYIKYFLVLCLQLNTNLIKYLQVIQGLHI